MIQRVARSLSAKPYSDVDLILDTFDFPYTDSGSWDGPYEYALDMLRAGKDDDALIELDGYLRGDPATLRHVGDDEIWRAGSFRLFISHTSAHKERAARLAEVAGRVGIHGFVAHDTIEPTRQWQDVIEAALLSCDALCAMLTDDFVSSRWCDQEVGFAVAQGKPVLPLKMGADPHGFIGKYQAIPSRLSPDTSFHDVDAILLALVRQPRTAEKAAPIAVRRYVMSKSYDAARGGFKLLQAIPPKEWTAAMIEDVDRANEENSQLADAVLLPDGQPVPGAVAALLKDVRRRTTPPATVASDADIPF